MFQVIPKLLSRPGGNDALPFTSAGGTISGPNAGIVRMYTPALGDGSRAGAPPGVTGGATPSMGGPISGNIDLRAQRDDLRAAGAAFQRTGQASLATALAAGFAASTNPSLQSMNAHLAKIVEQIPLATDEAQIATLIAAQQSIGTSIAKDEERARIGQLYDALKASWDRPITVNLTVPVTVRDITTKVTTSTRIGPTTGSAGGRFLGAQ